MWLVELAGLDGPDLLPYALARSLGVHERPDDGIQDVLLAYLRGRRLLLMLDNCEHLLEACRELVAALVSGCAGVRILCTGRTARARRSTRLTRETAGCRQLASLRSVVQPGASRQAACALVT